MPHLVVLYSSNLEAEVDFGQVCRTLADTMIAQRDGAGNRVFPTGGVRVLAYPAAHSAIADGSRDGPAGYGFVYLNLRMAKGRSAAVHASVGLAFRQAARAAFEPALQRRHFGVTIQIDEGQEIYDAKIGNLHPLFAKD